MFSFFKRSHPAPGWAGEMLRMSGAEPVLVLGMEGALMVEASLAPPGTDPPAYWAWAGAWAAPEQRAMTTAIRVRRGMTCLLAKMALYCGAGSFSESSFDLPDGSHRPR
jgi:hypothetical protein